MPGKRATAWLAVCAVAVASAATATEVRIERRLGDAAAASQSAWVGIFDDPVAPGASARRWVSFDGSAFGLSLTGERLPATLAVLVPECARPALHRIERSQDEVRLVVGAPCGPALTGVLRSDFSEDDLALPYVQVTIAEAPGSGPELPEYVLARWRSTAEGVVSIPGVAPGRYEVSALSDWHVPRTAPIVVDDGAEDGRRFELEVARIGREVIGRVVDPDGRGVVGAKVVATTGPSIVEGVTGRNGRFVLAPLERAQWETVVASHGRTTSLPHRVHSSTPRLEVVLGGAAWIRGVVYDQSTNAPVDDFEVTVHVSGRTARRRAFRDLGGRFAVDFGGFPDPDARVAIEVRAGGYATFAEQLHRERLRETTFVPVPMQHGHVMAGRVVAAADGMPIGGARVEAPGYFVPVGLWMLGSTTTFADADGRFEIRLSEIGERSLRASAAGYAPMVTPVPDDGDGALTIALAQGGEIVGDMVLPDGMPAPGRVSLHSVPNPVPDDDEYVDFWQMRENIDGTAHATVAADGRFRFRDLAARRYNLSGESPAGAVAPRTVEVAAYGTAPPVRVVVEPLARVTGVVAGLDPDERVMLSVREQDRPDEVAWDSVWKLPAVASTEYIANGPFEIGDLPNGRFVLAAWSTAQRQISIPFVIEDRAAAQVDVTLVGRSRLFGRVLRDGQGVQWADVVAWHAGTPRRAGSYYTGEDGRYAIGGLEDGGYEVVAQGNRFPVEVRGDTQLDLPLTLYSLSGAVRLNGRSRERQRFITVKALDMPGADGRPVRVASARIARGEYRFDGLAEGRYLLVYPDPFVDGAVRRIRLSADVSGFDFDLQPSDDLRQARVVPWPRSPKWPLRVSAESGAFAHIAFEVPLDEGGVGLLPASLRGAHLRFNPAREVTTVDIPAWNGEDLVLELGDGGQ